MFFNKYLLKTDNIIWLDKTYVNNYLPKMSLNNLNILKHLPVVMHLKKMPLSFSAILPFQLSSPTKNIEFCVLQFITFCIPLYFCNPRKIMVSSPVHNILKETKSFKLKCF